MTLINFDKSKVKETLTLENIYELLEQYGADPEYTSFGMIGATICHNPIGEGSKKLYYYQNSQLFHCYTGGCEEPSFDIFELTIKVFRIQQGKVIDLNSAVRFIAAKFGISGEYEAEDLELPSDWRIFDGYNRVQDIELKDYSVHLKEYDSTILSRLNYNCILEPWLKEGITQETIDYAQIGYYPGADMITIPHFDADGRFVGLRGRAMAADDIERFGKYRPLRLNKETIYNHPLGMNLYGLNWAKDNIATIGKAIIFESEKSALQYMSFFGPENSIAVACCGSNISAYHIHMLKEAGAKEVIVAFDRQFQAVGDEEFKRLTASLTKTYEKYKNDVLISFIFDKNMITGYKDSPTDKGKDIFLKLFQSRIFLDK